MSTIGHEGVHLADDVERLTGLAITVARGCLPGHLHRVAAEGDVVGAGRAASLDAAIGDHHVGRGLERAEADVDRELHRGIEIAR